MLAEATGVSKGDGAGGCCKSKKEDGEGLSTFNSLIKAPFVSLACNGLATGRIRRFCLSYHARTLIDPPASSARDLTCLLFTADDDQGRRVSPVYASQAHEYYQTQLN